MSTEPSSPQPVSTAELLAMATEAAALARAGLPLERGLRTISGDVPRGLRDALLRLAQRLEQGASLADAFAAAGNRLTPTLRVVVAAGLRARRLPVVLEQFVAATRERIELRRLVSGALIYPVLVVLLACLVLSMLLAVVSEIGDGFESLRAPLKGAARTLVHLRDSTWLAPPWLLLGVALATVTSWPLLAMLQRWAWTRSGPSAHRLPLCGPLVADARTANFVGLWHVLAEQSVPLAETLRLSADACENRPLAMQAARAASRAERGETMAAVVSELVSLPASVRWSIAVSGQHGQLAASLAEIAALYRQRAASRAQVLRTVLPALLVILMAGTATLLCVLLLFYPWTTLLHELAETVGG
ncbi:MAG: type II secretion system F family protein [Pirellulales bacterium]|nr:type II secretion system F family protein [Pirellulales bacterium]